MPARKTASRSAGANDTDGAKRTEKVAHEKSELLKGTLDMLILQTVSVQPMHGYGIASYIEQISEAVLTVEQGSLYPALERLLKKGWVKAKWGASPTGRRARYYTITASGQRQLGAEISSFDRVLVAMNRVLKRV